jgi:hypothetical protein
MSSFAKLSLVKELLSMDGGVVGISRSMGETGPVLRTVIDEVGRS